MIPGQYFILRFDFSDVSRDSNPELAALSLKDSMTASFKKFYNMYATYLGENASKLYENINSRDPANSLTNCILSVDRVLTNPKESREDLAGVQGVRYNLSFRQIAPMND